MKSRFVSYVLFTFFIVSNTIALTVLYLDIIFTLGMLTDNNFFNFSFLLNIFYMIVYTTLFWKTIIIWKQNERQKAYLISIIGIWLLFFIILVGCSYEFSRNPLHI